MVENEKLLALKEKTLSDKTTNFSLKEAFGIAICDNVEYIENLLKSKGGGIQKKHMVITDQILEKEEPKAYKETDGKLYYEFDWEFIEAMAKRMQNNKKGKYELYNWKKPMEPDNIKQAINRHHIEVMKGNYDDGDVFLDHIVAYATNSMILWHQLKKNEVTQINNN